MSWARRLVLGLGFLTLVGGVFLLAFTQVTKVFVDPKHFEAGHGESSTVADATYVILSALVMATGFATVLAATTATRGWRRAVAVTGCGLTTFCLLSLHLTLLINAVTVSTENELYVSFTAGYLFHTSPLYTLIVVFILFLVTIGLLAGFVAATGYLLLPHRFGRSVWPREDWSKNEAALVVSSVVLALTLVIFLVFLVKVAVEGDLAADEKVTFFSQNLVAFYYLQILMLGAVLVLVAARVFLINWGFQLPVARSTLLESLGSTGRVERVLLIAATILNLLILASPAAADTSLLSEDPAFLLASRGLAWCCFLIAFPYALYAVSLRRLSALARAGRPFAARRPFLDASLRTILAEVAGLALISAAGLGAQWSPLGLMIALSAWTTAVLFVSAVRFRFESGRFEARLRPEEGPTFYFGFVVFAAATGLMMWGAGNTFVATYQQSADALSIDNASPYGADILFRVAGAALLSFALLFSLFLARASLGVSRPLTGHFVSAFLSLVVTGLVVFSVYVWNKGERGIDDVYAGFSFHQFYLEEKILVGCLILGLSTLLLWNLGRIVHALVEPRLRAVLR